VALRRYPFRASNAQSIATLYMYIPHGLTPVLWTLRPTGPLADRAHSMPRLPLGGVRLHALRARVPRWPESFCRPGDRLQGEGPRLGVNPGPFEHSASLQTPAAHIGAHGSLGSHSVTRRGHWHTQAWFPTRGCWHIALDGGARSHGTSGQGSSGDEPPACVASSLLSDAHCSR
jgi:hypothetical protein